MTTKKGRQGRAATTKKAGRVSVHGGGYLHTAMLNVAGKVKKAVKRAVATEARRVAGARKRR